MHTIGIIGPMEVEVTLLKKSLTNLETKTLRGLEFYIGTYADKRVIVVRSGIGKVNAARTTQLLIDAFAPDAIVNSGIGGGIGAGLHVGDLVIGEKLIQHDFDLTPLGFVRGSIPGTIGTPAEISEFAASPVLIQAYQKAIQAFPEVHARTGCIVSGDQFIASADKKKDLQDSFNADVAEMEGAAIAQVAVLNDVPFAVLRTLSDTADGEATESYATFEEKVANLASQITLKMLESI